VVGAVVVVGGGSVVVGSVGAVVVGSGVEEGDDEDVAEGRGGRGDRGAA
jgi:hypothetical protein